MPSAKAYFGRGQYHNLGGTTHSMKASAGRVRSFVFSGPAGKINLPTANVIRISNEVIGGPMYYILNVGAVNACDLNDSSGTFVQVLTPLTGCVVCLVDDSSPIGEWAVGPVQSLSFV